MNHAPDSAIRRDFTWTAIGWCSQCGPYQSAREHICPDGTKPVDMTLELPNGLFQGGTREPGKQVRQGGHGDRAESPS